ncbi:MAG: hypothetical protein A3G34_03550 [Candidatus Lindowbacteria bacterium RIFCSPLOWO2_12_FULL_62_27]|nr:MAG: hypothetical protein A3G34_03550 [Candidatus Lindowbacteria bacterium RIFCSPLOWO2_12_FULL_62_27]OGH63747.1 MAG: hypothetical protein A3I06_06565 [Candidatus Lindowbacteria bacterium RIFCSPLOWO2_02_FULL_62_12]
MKSKFFYGVLSLTLLVGFILAQAQPADAIAAWGRKYSVSCSACHRGQWDLNKDGQEFLRRGHRYEQEKAGPNVNEHLSFSTKFRVKYSETSDPRSTFEHHAFAIYTGGALTEQFSYFTEIYLHENAGKPATNTQPESDDGGRTKLAEGFLQWTSSDGPQYNSVRVGQIMPSLIHRFGGGSRLSYARPLVLTTEDTATANRQAGYAFFSRDYGIEYSRKHDDVFFAAGLVNGGKGKASVFNSTDTDNHRDWYATADYTYDDNGSMVGYYFYDGNVSKPSWAGTAGAVPSKFKRHAVMGNYILDNYKLTGFWAWGERRFLDGGTKPKLKLYYGQIEAYDLEKYAKMSWPLSAYVRHEFIDYNKDNRASDIVRQNVAGLQIEPFEYGHVVIEWTGKRDQTSSTVVDQNATVVELQYLW